MVPSDVKRDRSTPRAGDFFADDLPSADAYILMEVNARLAR